jgi:molybdopterin synthase sulfur carrier subunit
MERPADVTLFLPGPLRAACGGASTLAIDARDVREVLQAIGEGYPALYRNVCDETGAVRRHLNVFVNATHIRELAGLDTALASGDQVTILPAVSGG